MNWGSGARHLGHGVSALLDGQLNAAEADRAWQHVASCDLCREAVQRETWIKQRMAGLSALTTAPPSLKGDLLRPEYCTPRRERRSISLAAVGGGAVGAAMMGFIALSPAPAAAPTPTGSTYVPANATVIQPASMVYVRR